MKAKEIIQKIESFAPSSLACAWDNPGLLCGSGEKDIKKVYLTLDTTLTTVMEAIEKGADMIISHHPILMSGIKKIDFSTPEGKMLELLIKNDIVVFAAHTNIDAAENGINQRLAEIFELENIGILEPVDENCGIGRFGDLKSEISSYEFAETVKEKLNTPYIRISGQRNIKKLGICSGSGADFVGYAIENGCDCLLTGDVKYHNAIDAALLNICIIDAGHFPTEKLVCNIFHEILAECPLEFIYSDNTDIFKFI